MTKFRKEKSWLNLLCIGLLFVLLLANCLNNEPTDNGLPRWQFLVLEDKFALNLRLYKPHLYVCAGSDGLWRKDIESEDSEWEYLGLADTSLGEYINRGVQDVIIDESNPNWLMVSYQPDLGSDHGIYRSFDAGQNWAPADSGLQFSVGGERFFRRVHKLLEYPGQIVGAGHGVYITNNFGQHWQRLSEDPQVGGEPVYLFRRHPAKPALIWLGGEGIVFQPVLAFSFDSGATWTPINLSQVVPVDNAVYSIAFDPSDEDVVYVGMQGAIIKTKDSGESWIVPLVTNPQGEFFRAILADPRNPAHLWAAAGNSLIETWDEGITWEQVESPIPETTKVFDIIWDEKTQGMYIGTLNGVYHYEP